MLTASLILHGGVAIGLGLTYFHGAPASVVVASSETKTPTVILLSTKETSEFLPAREIKPVTAQSTATSEPGIIPSPAPEMVDDKRSTVAPPPTLALATNLDAHIRALAPEVILSPNPPPHLDGKGGVVFVLDISGSMYEPCNGSTRLALAREELTRRILALKNGTPFAITLYAQTAYTSGPLVSANDVTRDAAVRFVMQDVDCGGGTNLPAGLASAKQLHTGALVLVSDGDLNISAFNLAAKARAILGPQGHCPGLTVVGIAPRPTTGDERLLQGLAEQQGGAYRAEQFGGDAGMVTSASGATKPASATP